MKILDTLEVFVDIMLVISASLLFKAYSRNSNLAAGAKDGHNNLLAALL